tara:strand:+ start:197 stop:1123 length:927 start_codon:yes stop_codon:yes gene_type:complete
LPAQPRLAAIEAGGTKLIVSVGQDWQTAEQVTIPTTTPSKTLKAVIRFLQAQYQKAPFAAIGVGSFGPIAVNKTEPRFGEILATPKPGWEGFSFVNALAQFNRPIDIETDVNAAALAEAHFGAGQHCDRVVYVTVGTGIGAGLVIDRKISNGFMHPEFGHIPVPHHVDDSSENCICPFHNNCLEGFASGPSIAQRWGATLDELSITHDAYEREAYYLGIMSANLILSLMPHRILIGGGVAQAEGLIDRVRQQTRKQLNGYLQLINSDAAIATIIQRPGLGNNAGIAGAYLMAHNALKSTFSQSPLAGA